MKDDPRELFVIKALQAVVDAGETLETDEVDGLKQIIEAVVIDRRREGKP